jgi:hypothetical protein
MTNHVRKRNKKTLTRSWYDGRYNINAGLLDQNWGCDKGRAG